MEKMKLLTFTRSRNTADTDPGQEYIFSRVFDDENKKIDYTNYSYKTYDEFLSLILQRKEKCLYIDDWAESNILNNLFDSADPFRDYLLQIYQDQKESYEQYYFYISLDKLRQIIENDVMEDGRSLSSNKKLHLKSDLSFIFDFNKYIGKNNENVSLYLTYDENNSEYQKGISYIGVGEIKDFSKQIENKEVTTEYKFTYYEFNFINVEVFKNISKITVYGPIGTGFLLNRKPYLIYIQDFDNIDIETHYERETLEERLEDLRNGIYELDTHGKILLESITFPKQAIPFIGDDEEEIIRIILYYEDE